MKKGFKFSVMLIIAVVMLFAMFAAACDDGAGKHVCEHVCPICGLCTDPDCDDPVCAEKCQGHAPHECEEKCPVCGKCIDMTCEEAVCADKCGSQHANNMEFVVTDLKVAKTNVTVDTSGFVTDFNLANGGALTYQFNSAEDCTVTMSVFVRRTVASPVYTDYVTITVNGDKFTSPAKVPALSGSATATWSEVNLGCLNLDKGSNVISLVAGGDGANCWAFKSVKLYYDKTVSLEQASEAVWHDCESVCAVCGGCTNFSCYNPGCANKCTCVSQTHSKASLYWVCDERVYTNRAVNKELDGIGCTWNKTTAMEYRIVADKAGKVEYGAVISTDTFDILFTDQFKITVNGNPVDPGFGKCPVTEVREWNTYLLVDVGYLELQEGKNNIRIEQTPVKIESGGNGGAYNFQSFVIFSDDVTTSWFEHTCESKCDICGGCQNAECTEWECETKCPGHINKDVEFTGADVTITDDSNYKVQPETFYNFEYLNLNEGEDILIDDDTGKAFNGAALASGSTLTVRFTLEADATVALRPFMTPVTIPETEDGYSIDGIIGFKVDGQEVTEYVLQKAGKGGWTAGQQYVNVGTGSYNFTAGTHTLEIIIKGENAPHINEIRLNVQQYGSWAADGIVLGGDAPAVSASAAVQDVFNGPVFLTANTKIASRYSLPASVLR